MTKTFFNTVLAFLLVGAGISLLLINLGILPVDMLEIWEYLYPLIFIVLGLNWLWNGFANYRRRKNLRPFGWFWGLTFLTLGSLLLLSKAGHINFTLRQVWQLWPLLLVYVGINILSGHLRQSRMAFGEVRFGGHNHRRPETGEDSRENNGGEGRSRDRDGRFRDRKGEGQNVLRSLKYDQNNWKVEPLDLWHGVADYRFDFSKAFIPEEDTPIKLSGWVGDIDIILPGDVAFSVIARSSVGDIDILGTTQEGVNPYVNYKTPDYDEAARKLSFDFDFKVLDLQIDRV